MSANGTAEVPVQPTSVKLPYFLGCPMWGNRQWAGHFFTSGAKVSDYLCQYSQVFNSVEGNTTFYGLPSAETVARWTDDAANGFQFCFKFPQRISHAKGLVDATDDTARFFATLEPLQAHLGPFLLQLPADFSPARLPVLADFLQGLPGEYSYTVEVRHLGFFNDQDADDALCALLSQHGMDRVMFDTRPLFSARAQTAAVRDAQNKKPRVPANTYALGNNPCLRFIGHPDPQRSKEYFRPWLRKVARWVDEGRQPFVFIHTPDNADVPQLARDFHQGLLEFMPQLPDLAPFPAQTSPGAVPVASADTPVDTDQMDLF